MVQTAYFTGQQCKHNVHLITISWAHTVVDIDQL